MGRLRFNPNADKIIKSNKYVIDTFTNDIFFNNNPIYIEIGMGKGDFIINNAINNPKINYIGIEKFSTVLAIATKKLTELNLYNLKLMCKDANELNQVFTPNSINKIFLNFSDPWPKARHEKRRLTSINFLNIYKNILKEDGIIEFKTDNLKLYEWSLETLLNIKDVKIIYFCSDIYKELDNEYNINNIQTEYEKKFISKNVSIKKIIFKFI